MNLRIALLCLLAATGSTALRAQSPQAPRPLSWPKAGRMTRPWVRWWWLGSAVDSAGIAANLEALDRAGIGGVEITPIYGVKGYESSFRSYLSASWMRMLSYSIRKAGALDMGVDMNNGTGWPFGGPNIPDSLAARRVLLCRYNLSAGQVLDTVLRPADPHARDVRLQALMAYGPQGRHLDLLDRADAAGHLRWHAPQGSWQVIALFDVMTGQRVKRASPGGVGWVMDYFSRQALDTYLKRFDTAFARSACPVPHAFFNDSYEVFGADWTNRFLEAFARWRGYRLQDELPCLMGEGSPDSVQRVEADYRRTLAELLLEDFTEPWTAWTHRMGSISRNQAHGSPGNLLDLYGAADIPEVESFGACRFDIAGLQQDSLGTRSGRLDPLLLKFASSAAHVQGRAYCSSETFTWLGEHFRVSLADCKPVLDEMFLSGINHVFFHGSPYSPPGAPWPGWQFYASVNFSPYNPIWQDIRSFDAYITRAQAFLQSGRPDNPVLLYWPAQDVWAMHEHSLLFPLSISGGARWLDPTSFHRVAGRLSQLGYGMDYISDAQLSSCSAGPSGIRTPGGRYRVLVVPPCRFIPLGTLRKLLDLARQGAKIAFAGSLPQSASGLEHLASRKRELLGLERQLGSSPGRIARLGLGRVWQGADLASAMRACGLEPSGFARADLPFIRRKTAYGSVYFTSNLQAKAFRGWISLPCTIHAVALFDPMTGHSGMARLRWHKGKPQAYLELNSGASILLKCFDSEVAGQRRWEYLEPAGGGLMLSGPWQLRFVSGGPHIDRVYRLDSLVSWTELGQRPRRFSGSANYLIHFRLHKGNVRHWLLDLGKLDVAARVFVNGRHAADLWALPYRCDIGPLLREGANSLELRVNNLGANRIADYDRRHIAWKIFDEINFVNMAYKPFDASGWKPVASGLLGPVRLLALKSRLRDSP